MTEENNAGTGGADGGDAGSGAGEGGGAGAVQTPAWMNSAPDAFKQNEHFAKFAEPADFYAKADELMKAEGSNLKIPGEDATPEEKDAFAQKMGRPETAEGYEFAKPAEWPEGVPYNSELEAGFREMAFNAGIPAAQAKGMLDWYNKVSVDEHNAVIEATNKSVDALKDKWTGDDFKVNSEIAMRAMMKFAGESVGAEEAKTFFETATIDGIAVGSHPIMAQIFKAVGVMTGDDTTSGGRGGAGGERSEEQKAKDRFKNTKW
jgi:hypothetical protein